MSEPYQSYSGPTEGHAPAGPAGPPPRSTVTAVNLMFVLAALALVNLVVALLFRGSVRDTIRQSSSGLSEAQVNTTVNVLIVGSVVIGVVFLVLYVLLAFQVRKGKSWARIVTLILSILGALSAFSVLAQQASLVQKVVAVVEIVLYVVLIVMLFRPDSRAYFVRR